MINRHPHWRETAGKPECCKVAIPAPGGEPLIFCSTGSNWVQSARCPGVTIKDSGRQHPSALR
ncbi:hypothetical protein GCM10009753_45320 [Streptantibioticus ferralitis]